MVGWTYRRLDNPGDGGFEALHHGRRPAQKWLFGTVGMAVISAVLAGMMAIFVK